MTRAWIGAAALALTAFAGDALAQREAEKPELLVLGVSHFTNPGRDLVSPQVGDLTTAERQAELQALVARLASFAPTHVVVEWPAARQDALDGLYRDYLAGAREPAMTEHEQIGFRLAEAAGLERVHAADWNGNPPGDPAAYDWPAFAEAQGGPGAVADIAAAAQGAIPALGDQTVTDWLIAMNAPETLAAAHRPYFAIARIGGAEAQPGAAWVGTWYARNLRIFDAIADLAGPGDRIVVIYGHGHAYLLNQFGRESGAFEVVAAGEALD